MPWTHLKVFVWWGFESKFSVNLWSMTSLKLRPNWTITSKVFSDFICSFIEIVASYCYINNYPSNLSASIILLNLNLTIPLLFIAKKCTTYILKFNWKKKPFLKICLTYYNSKLTFKNIIIFTFYSLFVIRNFLNKLDT